MMRTLAAFLSIAGWLAGQPSQLDNLEKNLAAHPNDAGIRSGILNLLADPNEPTPRERVIETRRQNVFWFIENRAAANTWMPATQLIPPTGPLADPEGYAQSLRLWQQAGETTAVIANAAIYLKATGRKQARAMLDAALNEYPDDPALERALGVLDAAAMAGISGVAERQQFSTTASLREAPEAQSARNEIEASRNPDLLSGAAQMLSSNLIQNEFQISYGDDDGTSLAERWLRRALEIEPSGALEKQLAPVLRLQANRAEDPHERVRLYSEAVALSPDPTLVPDLAQAEFEAGDDASAERDARRALETAPGLVQRNKNLAAILTHRGETILGRIALAHGDISQARARLLASLQLPAIPPPLEFNGPDLSLAADLADAGEVDSVLEFLENTRKFWLYDGGRIDHAIRMVKAGKKARSFAPFEHPSFDILHQPAPPFHLRDLAGAEWTLDSLAHAPAALIFWNAACASCAGQIAQFSKEAAALHIRLLAVNLGDDPARVRAFAEKNHVAVPVLAGASDAFLHQYRADTCPSVALIDSKGIISQYQVGAAQNPRRVLESVAHPPLAKPVPLAAAVAESGVTLSWKPSAGAQSYLVEWEARDAKGWPSERDGFLRVVPTRDTRVDLACSGTIRWRVYAVTSSARSDSTAWQKACDLQ